MRSNHVTLTLCLAVCGALSAGCKRSSDAGHGEALQATAYQNAHLLIDPPGQSEQPALYNVTFADRVVLVFDEQHSGRPHGQDSARQWTVAMELPAFNLDTAAKRGTIDLAASKALLFGRAMADKVTFLSFTATGTIALFKNGQEWSADLDVTFTSPTIATGSDKTMQLKGHFALAVERVEPGPMR